MGEVLMAKEWWCGCGSDGVGEGVMAWEWCCE